MATFGSEEPCLRAYAGPGAVIATSHYRAEDAAHQHYLAKNPFGYRCHANNGVNFPG
jgi:hypothetical protein